MMAIVFLTFLLGFVTCYLGAWALALFSVWGRHGVPPCWPCIAADLVAALLWPMAFWLLADEGD